MHDGSKTLLRLGLAKEAFTEAEAIVEHLISLGRETSDPLGAALCAGAIVTYARPFTKSYGLGRLSDHFECFPNSSIGRELSPIHEALLEARNQVFAHRDINRANNAARGGRTVDPQQIVLEFLPIGVEVQVQDRLIKRDVVVKSAELFRFQRARVEDELLRTIGRLFGAGGIPTVGRYKINRDGIEPLG